MCRSKKPNKRYMWQMSSVALSLITFVTFVKWWLLLPYDIFRIMTFVALLRLSHCDVCRLMTFVALWDLYEVCNLLMFVALWRFSLIWFVACSVKIMSLSLNYPLHIVVQCRFDKFCKIQPWFPLHRSPVTADILMS